MSYEILTRLGIPVIPFLFTAAPEDEAAAIEWLERRPRIAVIAVLAKFYPSLEAFSGLVESTAALGARVNRELSYVVFGAATREKFEIALARLHRVRFVSSKPVMKGMWGKISTAGLSFEDGRPRPPEDLPPRNILQFERAVASLAPAP